tara:strand:- start:196 stop:441 length:246 start_codon:yes stop_codon:yes gene_type:complete
MMDERHKIPDLVRVKEDTPEDLKVAIETFFEATKMIKEGYVEKMPGEYVANLIEVMSRYPEYEKISRELGTIVVKGIKDEI